MSNDIKQQLIKARALIENGWCQGSFSLLTLAAPQYCVSGALMAVGGDVFGPAYTVLSDLICAPNFSLSAWNDDPGRTKEEVLALFDKGIASLS